MLSFLIVSIVMVIDVTDIISYYVYYFIMVMDTENSI